MIYEYRRYEIAPGSAKALHERFANHTVRLMRSHGHDIVGFWEPVVGHANHLHYLLRWDDMAARERCSEAFETDPEWRAVLAATPGLTVRRYNELWRPTAYSPTIRAVWPDSDEE
jgi:hypothetical protein